MKITKMKTALRNISRIGILCFMVISLSSCGYNALVEKQEAVDAQWSQVENVYQSRSEKIPQLVKVVKGASNYEKETLEAVINARAKATSINLSADQLTEENMAKFDAAQSQLSGALSRLLVSVERYPELKANENYLRLQDEVTGMENRIVQERRKYNEAAKDYNTSTRTFPRNLTASMFGFDKKPYFKMKEGGDAVPEINL